jgi:hypothetical protein
MSRNDLGLRAVSTCIKEYLESVQCATQHDITNSIVDTYQSSNPEIPAKTLHRRIYDVITVFTCIGHIKKENQSLVWVGPNRPRESPRIADLAARTTRIESKEEALRYKARLLLLHRALISANRTAVSPAHKIQFPVMVIGQKGSDLTLHSDPIRHRICIEARHKPKILSPFEILSGKTFTAAAMEQAVAESPELLPFRDLLMARA